MNISYRQSGYAYATFIDEDDIDCIIQDSGMTPGCLLLGMQKHQMVLTKAMAADLLPLLQRFIETGTIGWKEENT